MLEEEIRQQFYASMAELGIEPRGEIYLHMDGKVHRFSTNEDRHGGTSGAYYIYSDGWPNWGIMDFHKHSEFQKFKFNSEGVKNFQFHGRSNEGSKANYTSPNKEEARRRAYEEWKRGNERELFYHSYILLKKLKDFGLAKVCSWPRYGDVCHEGDLMIPIISSDNWKFQSLQRITAQPLRMTGKHMKGIYPSTSLKGGFTPFYVTHPEKLVICEGYATASSVFTMSKGRNAVISAMSCNNLVDVARNFSQKYKHLPIIIAADNDESGLREAERCVKAGFAINFYAPKTNGQDWNDYYKML